MNRCGLSGTPTPQNKKLFIDRGITVCDEWRDFHTFSRWIAGTGWEPRCGMAIARKDPNGNYCPENCVLSTRQKMRNFSRRIRRINGKSIRDILTEQGVELSDGNDPRRKNVAQRYASYGWQIGDAVSGSRDGTAKRRTDSRPISSWYDENPLYATWMSIRSRCGCVKGCSDPYVRMIYEGIKVCEAWKDYKTFEAWCLGNGWKKGLQVARKDKRGDFSPENCVIVPWEENVNMRRNTVRVDGIPLRTIIGKPTRGRSDAEYRLVCDRIRRGCWDVESAVSVPKMSCSEAQQISARVQQERREAKHKEVAR